MIRWGVRLFANNDPLDDHSELLTLIRDFRGESRFETLFVVHPEPTAGQGRQTASRLSWHSGECKRT